MANFMTSKSNSIWKRLFELGLIDAFSFALELTTDKSVVDS